MASDDFNRADAATLGANWTTQTSNTFEILSNQAKVAVDASVSAFYSAASFPDNQYSQVVAAAVGAVATMGPTVRASGAVPNNSYYLLLAFPSGAGQGIYKVVNNSSSILQSVGFNIVADDVLRLEVSGTTIVAKKNGTQVGIDSSDTAVGSGSPGLFNNQNAAIEAAFDDWFGGGLGLTAYPIADISDGNWTPSAGTDLYATIDEAVTDDADYDRSGASPDDDVMEVRLTALGIPDDGDVTFTVRHKTA